MAHGFPLYTVHFFSFTSMPVDSELDLLRKATYGFVIHIDHLIPKCQPFIYAIIYLVLPVQLPDQLSYVILTAPRYRPWFHNRWHYVHPHHLHVAAVKKSIILGASLCAPHIYQVPVWPNRSVFALLDPWKSSRVNTPAIVVVLTVWQCSLSWTSFAFRLSAPPGFCREVYSRTCCKDYLYIKPTLLIKTVFYRSPGGMLTMLLNLNV